MSIGWWPSGSVQVLFFCVCFAVLLPSYDVRVEALLQKDSLLCSQTAQCDGFHWKLCSPLIPITTPIAITLKKNNRKQRMLQENLMEPLNHDTCWYVPHLLSAFCFWRWCKLRVEENGEQTDVCLSTAFTGHYFLLETGVHECPLNWFF